MKRLFAVFAFAVVTLGVMAKGGVGQVKSPDGTVTVSIECDEVLTISASQDGVVVLSPSKRLLRLRKQRRAVPIGQ